MIVQFWEEDKKVKLLFITVNLPCTLTVSFEVVI